MARPIDWIAEFAALEAAWPEMQRREEEHRQREREMWERFLRSMAARDVPEETE